MLWITAIIILVVNECGSGEKWFVNVLKGFGAVCGLYVAGSYLTGQLLALSVFALAAVTAVELYEKDSARQAAKRRFEDVSAELNRQPLVFTQRIDIPEDKQQDTVA